MIDVARGVRRTGATRWAALGVVLCLTAAAVEGGAGRCGDGVCEGPETAALCPEDCAGTSAGRVITADAPNPVRALVADLLEWRDSLDDGGFEFGTSCLHDLSSTEAIERLGDAARSGAWGLRIAAGHGERATLGVRAPIEKGEEMRFSLWARSRTGMATLSVRVLAAESWRGDLISLYTPAGAFAAGTDWTQFQFVMENHRGLAYVVLAVDVPAGAEVDTDDVAIDATQWKMADTLTGGRVGGGVTVPAIPAASVHFAVLIHIEDPSLLQQQEAYFLEQTAIFSELARVLHEHGGFLTIQPEEDWAMGAQRFDPSALADLAARYGVAYSTHTHGPNCIDSSGRPRSAEDCRRSASAPGWIPAVAACCDESVPVYLENLRRLLAEVSGIAVTDHNGNWEYGNPNDLAAVGVPTWSAFKDNRTQRTFDVLMNNPWRPSATSARDDPNGFLIHDPATNIVYLPGWGQAITQNLERLPARLAPMASQFIRFADPDRINTFYIVTHIGHFESDDGTPYVSVDRGTGEITRSDAFERDLAIWDRALGDIVDPLVTEGYLEWTSLAEMGRLFVEWESGCLTP